jgi:NAD-dependent dihydropyrimidine dehydrogenase PreA subunit
MNRNGQHINDYGLTERRAKKVKPLRFEGETTMPTSLSPTSVPVTVDEDKCIAHKGCTVCVDVCPLDVLAIDMVKGKAYMKFDECWYCMPCEKDCPTGAVHVDIPYLLR